MTNTTDLNIRLGASSIETGLYRILLSVAVWKAGGKGDVILTRDDLDGMTAAFAPSSPILMVEVDTETHGFKLRLLTPEQVQETWQQEHSGEQPPPSADT